MYRWRCVFALAIGVILYLSEFSVILCQAVCFVLGFSVLIYDDSTNRYNESSTQTDNSEEPVSQKSEELGTDEPDTIPQFVQEASHISQYPHVQNSLQKLFKCVYAQLVCPWYTAPELEDSQPLHKSLLAEFNLIMDQIIYTTMEIDLSTIFLGCVEIVTLHLRSSKHSDRSAAFTNKTEEMNVLRIFSEAIIHRVFPRHLWESNVYHCALKEILATNALSLVTLLSDPDTLNQLIVCKLDQVPLSNLIEEVHDPIYEDTSSSKRSEKSDMLLDEAEECQLEDGKAKKKGNKLKEKFSKVFRGLQPKNKKKKRIMEKTYMPQRISASLQTDGAVSSDDNVESDADKVESDAECDSIYLEEMMEFEMWKDGKWAVTVTNVQTKGEDLCFTIHVEESNYPKILHWNIMKTKSEIVCFYDQCKGDLLPSPSLLMEKSETVMNEEEAREGLEDFLQALVANEKLGHTQLVFNFFDPVQRVMSEGEQCDGMWVLMDEIASFLTNFQEHDELHKLIRKQEEKQDEIMDIFGIPEAKHQEELDTAQPVFTDPIKQCQNGDENMLVTDGCCSSTPEKTFACTFEEQDAGYGAYQTERVSSGTESTGENVMHIRARAKLLKSEQNPKRHPATDSFLVSDGGDLGHYTVDSPSKWHSDGNVIKKESLAHKKSGGIHKPDGEKKGSQPEKDIWSLPTVPKKKWRQSDANKVIFDLLKEISGNSSLLKFFKIVLRPFTPLINKIVTDRMNLSEAQVASYIDALCETIQPVGDVSQKPLRNVNERNETKEKAIQVIISKFCAVLNKTDVENTFNIFQNADENKKLIFMLLSHVLKEFLPGNPALDGTLKNCFSSWLR